jgi:hypothetical protein
LVAWQITDFHARRSKGAWRPHLQWRYNEGIVEGGLPEEDETFATDGSFARGLPLAKKRNLREE